MTCLRCGGTGRLADHPCSCPAGAAGRATLRRARADDRRLARARCAAFQAAAVFRESSLRIVTGEWRRGSRLIVKPTGSLRLLASAAESLSRAVRREALIELEVLGPDVARYHWRFSAELDRAVALERRRRSAPQHHVNLQEAR